MCKTTRHGVNPLFVCLTVCLFVCLSVCLFACLLVCLFACLSACLLACLFFFSSFFYCRNRYVLRVRQNTALFNAFQDLLPKDKAKSKKGFLTKMFAKDKKK
jgi:hypothetical protein